MKLRPTLLEVVLVASLLTGGAAIAPASASPGGQSGAAAPGAVRGCNPGEFCTYANDNHTVMVNRMSSCTWHRTRGYFGSYVNNQTRGTRARFYDSAREFLSKTQPAPYKGTTPLGEETFYFRPC